MHFFQILAYCVMLAIPKPRRILLWEYIHTHVFKESLLYGGIFLFVVTTSSLFDNGQQQQQTQQQAAADFFKDSKKYFLAAKKLQ